MRREFFKLTTLIVLTSAAAVLLFFGAGAQPALAEEYPLLSLYYVDCCFTDAEAVDVAKFDLVILTMEAAEYNARGIKRLRELNPDIVILPYVPSQGIDFANASATRQRLIDEVEQDWYLVRPDGTRISRYDGEYDLNITNQDVRVGITDFVADLNDDTCAGVHCWDGVFYDVVEDNVSYLGELDLNGDGIADSNVNSQWVDSYVKMFKRTRNLLGNKKRIIINGVSNLQMNKHVNGRMFESFPTPWHADGSWAGVADNTPTLQGANDSPISIIYSGEGGRKQYKKMRYAVVSGIITGSYAGYDNGVDRHNAIWAYDEYNTVLGKPLGDAYKPSDKSAAPFSAGVWRRDFEHGIALVNATDSKQTVSLGSGFEKLRGTQAPKINNGELVGTITLKPHDGRILLRRASQLNRAPYINGAFARVFDKTGQQARVSFFPFNAAHNGGETIVALEDVNKRVVADDTYVYIYKNDKLQYKFAPYGDQFRGGVNIAVGKLNGKRKAYRIVTGTKTGGAHVRIFNMKGQTKNPGCFPFGEISGGVNVAIGQVDNNHPKQEVIVGAGTGGGPQVRLVDRNCTVIHPGFFAYDPAFRGGVSVAAGDVDGDKNDEIVTMPGPGGGPHVRVLTKNGKEVRSFFAFDPNDRSGGQVAVSDIEGDGTMEIIAMTFGIFNF